MTSEKQKMLAGQDYDALDAELVSERQRARRLCRAFNISTEEQASERKRILHELFAACGRSVYIEPPFYCDYGNNTRLGDEVFFNFNCTILDCAAVTMGDRVLLGPSVQIYTATHPLPASERRKGMESAQAIEIGSDVWIGGGAILCPGVTVGSGSVIGAGSVVTHDVPDNCVAVGNPCQVIRKTSE